MTATAAPGTRRALPGAGVDLVATLREGAGVPVLLLHGLASSRRFWDPVLARLPGPALALDQRGHGESARPQGPYDGATVLRDALSALDDVGFGEVVVVGHSWGASTALRLAAAAPERVRAVVAVDGGVGRPGRGADRAATRRMLEPPRTALPLDELRARVAAGPLGPWWSAEVEAALLPLFAVGDDGLARARLPFEAHMAIVDDLLDTDPEQVLAQVRCPAWVAVAVPVGAADDWSTAKAAGLQRAGELLAQPRLVTWGGAVHDVPLQWPGLVAGLVRAAVEEVDR